MVDEEAFTASQPSQAPCMKPTEDHNPHTYLQFICNFVGSLISCLSFPVI